MRVICNEYKIDDSKLVIEHDIVKDDYIYRVVDLKTFTCRYTSEPISTLIACRAKGFQYMGVQT